MFVLVCEEPGKLEFVHRSPPGPLSGTDVLVRPRRVGICGTDFHIFEGTQPFVRYPRVMGHELAVEVVSAPEGAGVEDGEICAVNPYLSCGHCIACRRGKPNCCTSLSVLGVHQDGGMADLMALPAANLIPARELTVDECATVEFLAIGAHAVRRGAVGVGDRVLVVGGGPIGLGVALFARHAGGSVALCDLDAERASAAQSIAGARTFSGNEAPAEAMKAFTDGEGFDVVFDATGKAQAMETGFDVVANGGRYVLVSVVKETIGFADPDFHRKEMTLLGSRNATREDFERVVLAIQNKAVPVERLVTHRTTLRGAASDIPLWAQRKSGLIKALIEID